MRARLFRINATLLLTLGCRRFETIANALPLDVRVTGVSVEGADIIVLQIESESFDLVPDGEPIPEHPAPVIRQIR
jgi:hypothetical protein